MKYIKAPVKRFAGQISGAIFHSAIHSGPGEAPRISPGCSCICLFKKKKDPKQGDQTDKGGGILPVEDRFLTWGPTRLLFRSTSRSFTSTYFISGEGIFKSPAGAEQTRTFFTQLSVWSVPGTN